MCDPSDYRNYVRTVVRERVGNDDDVEDITQDVLLKFIKHRSEITGPEHTWLAVVAKNAAIDHLRSCPVRKTTALSEHWDTRTDCEWGLVEPSTQLGLRVLTESQLNVVEAQYRHGTNGGARKLGMTNASFKSILYRARASANRAVRNRV